MSTNFYYTPSFEPFSKFEALHIGKISAGWEFMFQAFEEEESTLTFESQQSCLTLRVGVPALKIKSAQDWRDFMNKSPGHIADEYGTPYSQDAFWLLVSGFSPKKTASGLVLRNHVDELYRSEHVFGKVDPSLCWKDLEGFAMLKREFS